MRPCHVCKYWLATALPVLCGCVCYSRFVYYRFVYVRVYIHMRILIHTYIIYITHINTWTYDNFCKSALFMLLLIVKTHSCTTSMCSKISIDIYKFAGNLHGTTLIGFRESLRRSKSRTRNHKPPRPAFHAWQRTCWSHVKTCMRKRKSSPHPGFHAYRAYWSQLKTWMRNHSPSCALRSLHSVRRLDLLSFERLRSLRGFWH